jgi:ATP-dependent Clp protease ATP-binding subunit ClpC
MFERYTEKARRIIFFGRYEASQFGSPYIETEHLLLGLLREDKALTSRFLAKTPVEAIRGQIEAATEKREHIPTSVDLPLSNESKRVLAYAAEEAERLSHRHIGTEHLLLGLLREEKSFAAQILNERGVRLSAVREQLTQQAHGSATAAPAQERPPSSPFSVDLTQQAMEGQLHPFVGRDKEMERLTHVLGRSTKHNAGLVGEPGVGKRAIVSGLAQHIAGERAPSLLANSRIIALDLAFFGHNQRNPGQQELLLAPNLVFFIHELFPMLAATPTGADLGPTEILKTAILGGKTRVICAATPDEYRAAREKHRWLDRCFRAIEVAAMTEAETLEVLRSAKNHLEKFHMVTYTDEAIQHAVRYSSLYVKDRHLPDKALDLMDEAAAYVNARQTQGPKEVMEVRKRLRFIGMRLENCIANHEFEKARFYSDEERKERENLRELVKKHGIDEAAGLQVTREDVEEVLALWTGTPVSTIRQGNTDRPETP